AIPLFFGLATGFRLELIRPPAGAQAARATSLDWALSLKLGEAAALGFDIKRWYSDGDPAIDTATSLSLSLALRLSKYWGFAFVARDLNAPRGRLDDPSTTLRRSFDFGVVIRPTGTRDIELGLEATLQATDAPRWVPRATLGVDIPYVGRA